MITDRDIAVKVVAEGKNPQDVKVIDLTQGEAITIGADDPIEEALRTMGQYQVRRLPVIDGTKLVGSSARPTSRGHCPTPRSATWSATSASPDQPALTRPTTRDVRTRRPGRTTGRAVGVPAGLIRLPTMAK
jgi:CBS-domain-containing membrane protein